MVRETCESINSTTEDDEDPPAGGARGRMKLVETREVIGLQQQARERGESLDTLDSTIPP